MCCIAAFQLSNEPKLIIDSLHNFSNCKNHDKIPHHYHVKTRPLKIQNPEERHTGLVHVYWAPQQDKRTEVKLCHFKLKTQKITIEVPHELQQMFLLNS